MTTRVLPSVEDSSHLTGLQLAVVRVLWARGESTVLEVRKALLPKRRLAPTTVATILARLERRGIVQHRATGRQYVYRAEVTEPEIRRSMVADFTQLLFDGSPAALISHLLAERDIEAGDLAEVKRLIEEASRNGAAKD